jgi:hypothetical protein
MSDLTAIAVEKARPAVERAFRAVYNLVEYAQDLNSRVPETLTDEQIFNLGFTDTSLFRQQYDQRTKQLQGEAAGRLAEFYKAWWGLGLLTVEGVLDRLIAAWPEKVYWAGIGAASPIAWVAHCALQVNNTITSAAGLVNLDLSQGGLQDEEMAKLIPAWNKVRQDLGTLALPPADEVRIGLEQAFAMVVAKQDERRLQELLLAATAAAPGLLAPGVSSDREPTLEERAIAIIVANKDQNLSAQKIADMLGCSRQTLYNHNIIKAALEANRNSRAGLPKGFRKRGGDVDSYRDDESD